MANKKLVANVDGVLLKVGNAIRSLYQGAPVPEGADADHVKHLSDLGLLVPDSDDVGTSDDGGARALGDVEPAKAPAKPAAKAT